ncbi:bZIP transcription factor 17-like [Vigna umbellata]|uniref:bZIP transcription factor 17-like n=1 Tax=Vigna umbellata TaxID=87088 RepID=UPI001F5E9382|nr:bZIP transcription factor 17-like [Vigna umbellata]
MTESMHAVEPSPEAAVLPVSDPLFDEFSTEFGSLPLLSMDSLFNSDTLPFTSDLEFGMDFDDNNGEFEITFDDLDEICIPSDVEDFLLPDACDPNNTSVLPPIDESSAKNSDSPRSDTSVVSGDRSFGVSRFFNSQASDSVSEGNSCKEGSHDAADVRVSNISSPESEFCDREESSGGPVSSQGSGNGGSGVYEAVNSPSPDSGSFERDITSSHEHAVMDKGVKLEEISGCDLKRKKVSCEGSATKHRRFSSSSVDTKTEKQTPSDVNAIDDDDEKRKARLMRNRESAQLSRQRKKHYVEELEEKVRSMNSIIADLSSKISYMVAENATLRQQVGAGVMCAPPPPAPGIYPHPPMAHMTYPWMPCAPYVVKPQGSHVPLVPIPRLKPQQPTSAPKGKKSDSKKSEGKTKKVASISFLGLFFFIMLFGGLVPLVDFKFGGLVDNVPDTGMSSFVSDRVYGQGGGKVWSVNGPRNGSERDEEVGFSNDRFSVKDKMNHERGRHLGEERGEREGPDNFGRQGNASEPLVASLYVPRNDKMVKIDGNLIIHSIMASEKAMASQTADAKEKRETGLAIPKDWDSALAIPEVGRHPNVYRVPAEQRKALASGSTKALKDHMKSSATDGKMQQWFREGLAGPMLSSGMCTEVFQFDVSPSPGAIVPATSVSNVSTEKRQNATSVKKTRNRRTLRGLPDSLNGSSLNITEELVKNMDKNHLHGNESSMVVSVLVDPKEAGDGDVDGMMRPKSLSRIFVVVLIDSVKYVTYSCGLPRASPHLVTAYV